MKGKSILAAIVATASALWHYRMIALGTAHVPVRAFPFVPATITMVAVVLSLYWWGKAKDEEE